MTSRRPGGRPSAPRASVGNPAAPQRLRILLLEDNPADARLTQERLRGSAIDCDVATALHDLHRQRVVHLDVKPSNIMLRRCADAGAMGLVAARRRKRA